MNRKCAYRIIMAFILIAFLMPENAKADTPKQSSCQWVYLSELAKHASHNDYASIPLKTSITHIPKHVRGDKEFDGNGPTIRAAATMTFQSRKIRVSLWMEAKETKSDWTTAAGTRDYTLFETKNGWYIKQIAQAMPQNGRMVVDYSTAINPNGYQYSYDMWSDGGHTDTSHSTYTINFVTQGDRVSTGLHKFVFVGDTKGSEAGTRTGVTAYSSISYIELCR